MGRVKLTEDESWHAFEAVKNFEREYQRDIAERGPRYQSPETSTPDRKVTYVTFIQYGVVAALISVLIVGALSLRFH
jgi:hypothetical protein